jgi:hypothetical protein
MNLRFNRIIIIELYDIRNIAGKGFEKGDPGEKNVPPCLKKNVNHVHRWKWKVTSTTLVVTQVLS